MRGPVYHPGHVDPLSMDKGDKEAVPGAATRAEIDLSKLRHNVKLIHARAVRAGIMAVVKADAYGHGAVAIARELQRSGVSRFAVATVWEAIELRQGRIQDPILVLSPAIPGTLPLYEAHGLGVTVNSLEVAEDVAEFVRPDHGLEVHLMIETGMGRIGTRIENVERAVRLLSSRAGIRLESIWTHLATADETASDYVELQLDRFARAIHTVRDSAPFIHVANSGALLNHHGLLDLGERSLVRPGIALYGLSPSPEFDQAAAAGFRPIMRFRTVVGHVQEMHDGESVSYARRWVSEGDRVVATVAAGYADGYPRNLTNKGKMGIRGRLYPVAGTVCMDMTMLDIGRSSETPQVHRGDEVIIFGDGGPSCFDVSRAAGTITYELTCRVGQRVPRDYLHPGSST